VKLDLALVPTDGSRQFVMLFGCVADLRHYLSNRLPAFVGDGVACAGPGVDRERCQNRPAATAALGDV
jgi:hypothetical protein